MGNQQQMGSSAPQEHSGIQVPFLSFPDIPEYCPHVHDWSWATSMSTFQLIGARKWGSLLKPLRSICHSSSFSFSGNTFVFWLWCHSTLHFLLPLCWLSVSFAGSSSSGRPWSIGLLQSDVPCHLLVFLLAKKFIQVWYYRQSQKDFLANPIFACFSG